MARRGFSAGRPIPEACPGGRSRRKLEARSLHRWRDLSGRRGGARSVRGGPPHPDSTRCLRLARRAARRSRQRAPLQRARAGPRTVHDPAPPPLARSVSRSLRARRLRDVDARARAPGHRRRRVRSQRVALGRHPAQPGREPGRLPGGRGLRAGIVLSRRRVHDQGEGAALRWRDVYAGVPARDHRLRRGLSLLRRPLRGQADERGPQVAPFLPISGAGGRRQEAGGRRLRAQPVRLASGPVQ